MSSETLLELAQSWCDLAVKTGAEYGQAFVEAGLDGRWETLPGRPEASLLTTRTGVGLLIRYLGRWHFGSAPATRPQELADWLTAATGSHVAAPRPRALPLSADALASYLDDRCAADQLRAGLSAGTVLEDVTAKTIAVVDSGGVANVTERSGIRLRCNAEMRARGELFRGFGRWFGHDARDATAERLAEVIDRGAGQAKTAAFAGRLASGHHQTPVVLAPGVGAGLMHELIGHALEADNLHRSSEYVTGLREQPKAAIAEFFLDDDATLIDGYGAATVDDEGVPSGRTPLVAHGHVLGALHTMRTAYDFDPSATVGHGRRRDYRHAALPRTTNTVVRRGSASRADLLMAPERGLLYIAAIGSGDVDINRGDFTFATTESYLVTKGGDWIPQRDVVLFGDARQALTRLVAIGDDLGMDNVTCSKQGQFIGIGLASPTMRFDALDWRG